MTVAAILLLVALRRETDGGGLVNLSRAAAGGAAAALVGASAGFGVARWFGPAGSVLSFGQAVVVGAGHACVSVPWPCCSIEETCGGCSRDRDGARRGRGESSSFWQTSNGGIGQHVRSPPG